MSLSRRSVQRIDPTTAARVLNLPVPRWSSHATVRDYLAHLLAELLAGDASAKYGMTGESDWRYDLYLPMRDAGLLPPWEDGYGVGHRMDGTDHPGDRQLADDLLTAAVHLMRTS